MPLFALTLARSTETSRREQRARVAELEEEGLALQKEWDALVATPVRWPFLIFFTVPSSRFVRALPDIAVAELLANLSLTTSSLASSLPLSHRSPVASVNLSSLRDHRQSPPLPSRTQQDPIHALQDSLKKIDNDKAKFHQYTTAITDRRESSKVQLAQAQKAKEDMSEFRRVRFLGRGRGFKCEKGGARDSEGWRRDAS
jgi:hypothetical protein